MPVLEVPLSTSPVFVTGIYHQLGRVAEEQRQWAKAEQYYQQALAIYSEFDDHFHQAGTYHSLGALAEAHQHGAQARAAYLSALEIFFSFDDMHYVRMVMHSLKGLWQVSGDASLLTAVAAIFKVRPEEIEEVWQGTPEEANDPISTAEPSAPSSVPQTAPASAPEVAMQPTEPEE